MSCCAVYVKEHLQSPIIVIYYSVGCPSSEPDSYLRIRLRISQLMSPKTLWKTEPQCCNKTGNARHLLSQLLLQLEHGM